MNVHKFWRVLLLLALLSPAAPADDAEKDRVSFAPNYATEIDINRINGLISVDGLLNEAAWQSATRVSNFVEINPGDLQQPGVNTEAMITYDETHLYVAFICDDDPDQIRASMRDRDEMWSDDYVGVLIDTYGNSHWAYFIFANPFGIQGDSRFSSTSGEDERFDLIYDSQGRITERGYQVEMAIPFSSLRFPDKTNQTWRINFWRNHPRNSRYQYSWTAINRDDPCFLCQYGTLNGIRNVQPVQPIELLPSLVGSQSSSLVDAEDPASQYKNSDVAGQMSLGLKWAVTPSLTIESSFNPDFSQVESDADQIDVNTTFALSFPEKRPFFQEGSDLFKTWNRVVYTRAINDPLAAAKIIGRWDKTTVAYLGAIDEHTPLILPFEEKSEFVAFDRSVSNIIRAKHTFGENSYIGAIATDRRLNAGGHSSVIGADAQLRFLNNYLFEMQLNYSFVREPDDPGATEDIDEFKFSRDSLTAAFDAESFNGRAVYLSLEKNSRHWSFEIDYRELSPTFRADNGFITGNNKRQLELWTGYTFYPDTKVIERIRPFISTARIWNFDGLAKDQWFVPGVWFRLGAQTNGEIMYLYNTERFGGVEFKNINRLRIWLNSRFSEPVSLGIWLQTGTSFSRSELVKGRSTDLEVWGTIKPLQRLVIRPSFAFAKLNRDDTGEKIYEGYILRTRLNYQFTRELFLRLVLQYNQFGDNFAIEPLLSYKLNPFSIFYIGTKYNYHHYGSPENWNQQSRQFFLKFQYLFRV